MNYVTRFVELNQYVHRVFSNFENRIYTLPFNLLTLSQVYERVFSPADARNLLESFKKNSEDRRNELTDLENLESKAKEMIGPELYRRLVEGYTWKQWNVHPKRLPGTTIARLPVRLNYDDRYFSDKYQGLPKQGYSDWFSRMLSSSNISTFLDTDYFEIRDMVGDIPTIFTGAVDRYFDFQEGELQWRTLDFEFETLDIDDYQGTSVMNFPDASVPFTRIHEFKHLHPEREYDETCTIIAKEYSKKAKRGDEPYYPVNSAEDRVMIRKYRDRMLNERRVHFGGRLGTYQYLDMHMAIGSALQFMETEFWNWWNQSRLLMKGRSDL
jgi:UDP-galactopyranose mutase